MTDTAKLIIEVTAGVLPPEVQWGEDPEEIAERLLAAKDGNGTQFIENLSTGFTRNRPEPEHTRRFAITSSEWHGSGPGQVDHSELLARYAGEALGYAQLLMLQPNRFNHVRVDWIWL